MQIGIELFWDDAAFHFKIHKIFLIFTIIIILNIYLSTYCNIFVIEPYI